LFLALAEEFPDYCLAAELAVALVALAAELPLPLAELPVLLLLRLLLDCPEKRIAAAPHHLSRLRLCPSRISCNLHQLFVHIHVLVCSSLEIFEHLGSPLRASDQHDFTCDTEFQMDVPRKLGQPHPQPTACRHRRVTKQEGISSSRKQ
jgi:hypothetical protein